jgi:hypothetical protein
MDRVGREEAEAEAEAEDVERSSGQVKTAKGASHARVNALMHVRIFLLLSALAALTNNNHGQKVDAEKPLSIIPVFILGR